MTKQTGRRKQGLRGERLVHRVSYVQLTLQLYIKLSGPMNTCTPLKDSHPCMSPCAPWLLLMGYMTIMDMQPAPIRKHMWVHFRDLMHDGQRFGWPAIRNFHGVWLQHIEQGRATWGDEVTRLDLRRSLVWHRLAPSAEPSSTPVSTSQAPSRGPRRTDNPCVAHIGDQACVAFNQGTCTSNAGHPADLHVCSHCLKTTRRLWNHPELICRS